MSQPADRTASSATFALALLATSVFFLYFAKDIPASSLSGKSDPGPRFLPVALCISIIAGACVEGAIALRRRFTTSTPPEAPDSVDNGSSRNVAILVAILIAYLAAISLLGFQLSTLLFGVVITMRLGARWWTGLIVTLTIVAVVRVLFVEVFHVQLPAGVWELAI